MKDGGCWSILWLLKGWALKDTHLRSSLAAKDFSTGLCCQVYLPWIRLFLQLTKMCLRDAGTEHVGRAGSSQSQRFRILEEGRTLQVVLMMKHPPVCLYNSKLAPSCFPPHNAHLFHPAALSGLWNSLEHLATSSCQHTSSHQDLMFGGICLLPGRYFLFSGWDLWDLCWM